MTRFYFTRIIFAHGLFFIFSINCSFSQEFLWQAGTHSFFNNHEFPGSRVKSSQTMAGVHFAPQIGLGYEGCHRAFVGIDAMSEFGSEKAVDYYSLMAYYRFDNKPFTFYMGSFPRKTALNRYPRMFFQDSVSNYRPLMNGMFLECRSKKDDYFNVWLDWTGRQTEKTREAFFIGWSGRYNKGIFYGEQFGYMFHFASSLKPAIPEYVNDNGLILTSIGIDFADKTFLEKLDVNIGWSIGLERDRGAGDGWQNPNGIVAELKIEYKKVGLFNTLYSGQGQQVRYNQHNNRLYWGDQTYRASKYNRADLYICFIKNSAVNVKLVYSLHFLEKKMFHEQALYATFDLNNIGKIL